MDGEMMKKMKMKMKMMKKVKIEDSLSEVDKDEYAPNVLSGPAAAYLTQENKYTEYLKGLVSVLPVSE